MIITKCTQKKLIRSLDRIVGSLLEISLTNHIFLKTFKSENDEIIVWFTDQNSQALEIEGRINLTMVIK